MGRVQFNDSLDILHSFTPAAPSPLLSVSNFPSLLFPLVLVLSFQIEVSQRFHDVYYFRDHMVLIPFGYGTLALKQNLPYMSKPLNQAHTGP